MEFATLPRKGALPRDMDWKVRLGTCGLSGPLSLPEMDVERLSLPSVARRASRSVVLSMTGPWLPCKHTWGKLRVELHGEAYIFRNRSGAPYSKDTLGDDFRTVRIAAFGERETRTLADFRRSGAHEAIAGEATPAALAHAMGNTLSASNALFATYCPVNLTTIQSVMVARRRGRTKLRENG